jgi:ribosomal protein S18 acetylase RimI-like enzyme
MLQIKRLRPEDFVLGQHCQQAFGHQKQSPERVFSVLSNPTNLWWVALQEEQVVGVLYGHWLDQWHSSTREFFVYDLEVHEDFHRQGIGTALLQAALDEAQKEENVSFVITNHSNVPAVALYEKLGGKREEGDELMLTFGEE